MRIVTWNCFKGDPKTRFNQLSAINPDICVLQECSKPTSENDRSVLWFGDNPRKGVGVVAASSYQIAVSPCQPIIEDTAYPVLITTPDEQIIHLLAIWSKPHPTYVEAIARCLEVYADFLCAAPSIVVGDFNSHSRWDKPKRAWTHTRLVQHLDNYFGLVSAFHAANPGIPEPATLYWRWNEQRPYHIDYCFIPNNWVSRISETYVGNYDEWKTESDHRPLLIEISDLKG
jgi:exonuclease III